MKKTGPLNPTELLSQKFTQQRQAGKAEHPETNKNKWKESPKIGRQRKNPQLKGMDESTEKELNVIEVSNIWDNELKNGYKDPQGT